MKVKTYDPSLVTVVMGGILVTGYSDGTHISVSYSEDANTIQVSNDGDVSYSRNPNRTGIMTLEVMSNSDSLADINKLIFDDNIITCSILDGNPGGESMNLIGCKPKNMPQFQRGKEVQPVTVEIWFASSQISA